MMAKLLLTLFWLTVAPVTAIAGADRPVGVESQAPAASPVAGPDSRDALSKAIRDAKARGEAPAANCAAGCPFPDYRIGGSCCNTFGCNCDGPCWNAGCSTACQQGKYPGRTTSCPGNDGHYNCCPSGSKCKSSKTCSAKRGECCCTGGGREITHIDSLEYDFGNATRIPDATASRVRIQYKGKNDGPNPHPVGSVDSTVSSTQTNEWSFQSSTTISAKATISAGIPLFEKGQLEVGVTETLGYGEKHTQSVGATLRITLGTDEIPPYSNQSYVFEASMYQYQIPFTAVAEVIDDCGTKSSEQVSGTTKLSGVASFTDGEFSKIIGPAVPVECREPFDTPIEKQRGTAFCSSGPLCADNALCVRYGQTTGTCCAKGSEQPCCAVAAANKACIEQGYDPDRQLCPSVNGNFAPCCNPRSALRRRYGAPADSTIQRNERQ